ncbi:hypothetical protein C8R45DRAFT_1158410, partial [Mycena sanguinolenta]
MQDSKLQVSRMANVDSHSSFLNTSTVPNVASRAFSEVAYKPAVRTSIRRLRRLLRRLSDGRDLSVLLRIRHIDLLVRAWGNSRRRRLRIGSGGRRCFLCGLSRCRRNGCLFLLYTLIHGALPLRLYTLLLSVLCLLRGLRPVLLTFLSRRRRRHHLDTRHACPRPHRLRVRMIALEHAHNWVRLRLRRGRRARRHHRAHLARTCRFFVGRRAGRLGLCPGAGILRMRTDLGPQVATTRIDDPH